MPRHFLSRVLLLTLACLLLNSLHAADRPPNIVLIFTDDQGYADVGVFGAKGYTTPNLDRLAEQGRRFTRFYVAQPVCSASRAALLTGCYPNRIGIHGALGPGARHGVHENEMTMAELVKQKGYATAIYGKWHLGHHPQFLPTNHGFDEYYGLPYSNDMWPNHPTANFPDLPLIEGTEILGYNTDQTKLTTDYTTRAVSFIERNREQPFFLYLPHSMPHVPLFVSDKFKGKSEQGLYGDVIMEIDWSVGEIMKALEKHGLVENTLVIFTTDNGPWLSYGDHAGSAEPLREGKGTTLEGGVRTPCIMRWPGKIPANTVCDTPLMTIDLLPTIAGLVGADLPIHPIDGMDVWPVISGDGTEKNPHDAYCFFYHGGDLEGVMTGNGQWKFHFPHNYRTLNGRPGGTGGQPVSYESAKTDLELYNLFQDVSETTDLAEHHPDVVARLQRFADQCREELGDRLTDRQGAGVRPPGRIAN